MVEFSEILADRERYYRFVGTSLGVAFANYENATIEYWQKDASDNISDTKLLALNKRYREARKVFLEILMKDVP